MPLTPEDTLVYGDLRRAQVLQPVEAHKLDEREGVILVSCGDADWYRYILKNHEKINGFHRENPRIHSVSLNGGALLIADESPLNKDLREDLVMIHHVQKARDLKNIHTVALYVHRPCGAAKLVGLDFLTTIDLLMKAKGRLKTELSSAVPFRVACFLHVVLADESEKTFFVSRENWLKWQKSPRAISYAPDSVASASSS